MLLLVCTLLSVLVAAVSGYAGTSTDLVREVKLNLRREIQALGTQDSNNRKWKVEQSPSIDDLVKRYASELERYAASETTFSLDFNDGLWDFIEGSWRLAYTNNFAGNPSTTLKSPVPLLIPGTDENDNRELLKIDSVVQKINYNANTNSKSIEHILHVKTPVSVGQVVLEHTVGVQSDRSPSQLYIDLKAVRLSGGLSPSFEKGLEELPAPLNSIGQTLRSTILALPLPVSKDLSTNRITAKLEVPLANIGLGPDCIRRGYFDVTFVDEDLRISRGPFGELRVFERL